MPANSRNARMFMDDPFSQSYEDFVYAIEREEAYTIQRRYIRQANKLRKVECSLLECLVTTLELNNSLKDSNYGTSN